VYKTIQYTKFVTHEMCVSWHLAESEANGNSEVKKIKRLQQNKSF